MKPFLYLMENAGLKLISHFPEVTVNMELITHSWLTVGRRLLEGLRGAALTPYFLLDPQTSDGSSGRLAESLSKTSGRITRFGNSLFLERILAHATGGCSFFPALSGFSWDPSVQMWLNILWKLFVL